MAAANSVQGLQEKATCPICLEYFTDPVTTKCGHNFCRSCISVCSEGADAALACAQCRELCPQGELSINRQLQSIVQLVKQLSAQRKRPREEEDLCEEHEERLKLFCEEDEKLICVICRESSDHEQHKVRPVKEATERYKKKLEAERRKIESEFKGMQQTLKEQKQKQLKRLEEMEKITTVENVQMAKLSAEMASLQTLITEMEKTCEQPAGEFLKDIRHVLRRLCPSLDVPSWTRPEALKNMAGDRYEQAMPDPTPEQIQKLYKELVTLDADTAHGLLALSEDGRRVTRTLTEQRRPDTPKRFTDSRSVLGREGFTSGRHYWELQVLREGDGWVAGVAREYVRRNGGVIHLPEEGVWAVRGFSDQYQALTSPRSSIFPHNPPLKLGFYLDYDGGCLSVYHKLVVRHTFTIEFFRERVFPYFCLYRGAELCLV